jgi:hypothetical protein
MQGYQYPYIPDYAKSGHKIPPWHHNRQEDQLAALTLCCGPQGIQGHQQGLQGFQGPAGPPYVPELFPTLTPPSNTFSLAQGGLHEIAESVAVLNFTATFDRGSIAPPYGTSGFRSGLPNTYDYTGPDLPATSASAALIDLQNPAPPGGYIVPNGTQAWTNTVSYDAGEQPKSSLGNDYDAPLPAGTTGAKTVTITGVYPYFATTVAMAVLTKQPLALMNSAYVQTDMIMEDDTNKQEAEFPVAWSAITGIEFYNTVSGHWEWICGTKANSLLTWTTSPTTETIQGNIINYTLWTNTSSKIGARMLRWHTD